MPLRPLPALVFAALLGATASAQDPMLEIVPWGQHEIVAGEVLVRFGADLSENGQRERHSEVGTSWVANITPRLGLARFTPGRDIDDVLAAYQEFADVEFAQPNVIHRPVEVPDDPKWVQQWHLATVGAPAAWDDYRGRADAIVAILDSGVDVDHVDLDDHLAWGLDTFAGDDDPDDLEGHGTHCAGIAAAETGNGVGIAGAGFSCRFAAYRCGNAAFPSSALVAAIHDARQRGAHVLSMSWGSGFNDPSIRAALQLAVDEGCIAVAAAGNSGSSAKFYPAALDFVVGVGASRPNDARASFSNFGPWVDVAAPGQTIYSTYHTGGYAYLSGTSMACPLVAGMAAHLYGAIGAERSAAAAALVVDALRNTAVDVGTWVAFGRVDFDAALDWLVPPAFPVLAGVSPAEVSPLGGESVTLTGTGLLRADRVEIDGALAEPPDALAVLDDATAVVTTPPLAALGPADVALRNPLGTSLPILLEIAPPDTPALTVDAVVWPGATLTWRFAGAPSHGYFVLASASPATAWAGPWAVLMPFFVVASGQLDAQTGLGTFAVTVPPVASGFSFHTQLVTVSGGISGASGISTVTIEP